MGVDKTHYVILGIDIQDLDMDFWGKEDKYLPYIEGHRDVKYSIINGSMDDNYCFFGKVLAKGDKQEGISLTTINEEEISYSEKEEILYKTNKLFDSDFNNPNEVKIYCFTKWW